MSNLVNKVKGAVSGNNPNSSNAGPHPSNAANKADPRVDSDLDGSRNAGLNQTTGTGVTGSAGNQGLTGSSTSTGTGYGSSTTGTGYQGNNPQSSNAGPHSSNLANKADPRVDSDLDGSRNAGANQTTGHHGHHNQHHGAEAAAGVGGAGLAAEGAHHHNQHHNTSTNAGPHSSNVANKADPRVDSDLDGSGNAGLNQTTGHHGQHGHHNQHHGAEAAAGVAGAGATAEGVHHHNQHHNQHHNTTSTNAGPHDSNLANKADPRVDSDRDGRRNAGLNQTTGTAGHSTTTGAAGTGAGVGSGAAAAAPGGPKTAGPHKSDLLNKLDPRVDSDLDGSKTIGGNKTGAGY